MSSKEKMMKEKNVLSSRVNIALILVSMMVAVLIIVTLYAAAGTGLIWLVLILMALLILLGIGVRKYIWKPHLETTKKLGCFATQGSREDLEQIRYYYSLQEKLAIYKTLEYMTTSTTLELSKRQAQYQALQNQINPHFLYNTLESIRSEALIEGLDSVANMCEALAGFFRYTISNMENLVTIEQELDNIKTYFYIQQYRFGQRLQLSISCSEDDWMIARNCLITKLTLQPIVENAIIHGIEQKVGDGKVTIHMMLTGKRLLIRVSDDGVGMDKEMLDRINRQMTERSVKGKSQGGIAVSNVHNRIKLIFGEAYGLTVYSTKGVGTEVEISLPRTLEQDRKSVERRMESER